MVSPSILGCVYLPCNGRGQTPVYTEVAHFARRQAKWHTSRTTTKYSANLKALSYNSFIK